MIGVIFILSLLLGLAAGLIPGIPGLIIFILVYRKRKQSVLLASYLVTAGILLILLILLNVLNLYLRNNFTGAMGEEDFSTFLSALFFFGTFPGLSLLLSNGVLFFVKKEPQGSGDS